MGQTGTDRDFELRDYFDDEEIDALNNKLAMILLENSDIDIDDIYSLVFCNGQKIIWS